MPPPANPHGESYRVSWIDPPTPSSTATKLTLGVTPVSVPDTKAVTSIICMKDVAKKYHDRSGIETPADVTAMIRLREGTFGVAAGPSPGGIRVGSIVSYTSTIHDVYEDLTAFSWS